MCAVFNLVAIFSGSFLLKFFTQVKSWGGEVCTRSHFPLSLPSTHLTPNNGKEECVQKGGERKREERGGRGGGERAEGQRGAGERVRERK